MVVEALVVGRARDGGAALECEVVHVAHGAALELGLKVVAEGTVGHGEAVDCGIASLGASPVLPWSVRSYW